MGWWPCGTPMPARVSYFRILKGETPRASDLRTLLGSSSMPEASEGIEKRTLVGSGLDARGIAAHPDGIARASDLS